MKLKTASTLRMVFAGAGLLLVPVYLIVRLDWLVFAAAALVFIAGLVYYLFARCPHCKRLLGMKHSDYCRSCRRKIEY